MDLDAISFVLQSCFEEPQLRNVVPQEDLGDAPYRRAAELVLEGEAPGEAISSWLDAQSVAQREKVSELLLADLRKSLVLEFLEPGRTLGLILWALLRDGRVGVSHLASHIYDTFNRGVRTPLEAERPAPSAVPEATVGETAELEHLDLQVPGDTSALGEVPGQAEKGPEQGRTEEYLGSLDLELTEEIEPGEDIEPEPEHLETSEEVLEGLESVLYPVGDERQPGSIDLIGTPDLCLEEELEEEVASAVPRMEDISSILEEDAGEMERVEKDLPTVRRETLEELGFSEEEEVFEPEAELPPPAEEPVSMPQERVAKIQEQPSRGQPYVTLAGIDVPIESLRRACCGVFGEPVELVTDGELLSKDKIAVVGKRCGIKILHGPSWTVDTQLPPEPRTGGPVTLSALSMEEALSKVFGEQIRLIPDPNLLGEGVVPIVGRQIGIVILRNEGARLDLPSWVDEEFAAKIGAATRVSHDDRLFEDVRKVQTLGDTLQTVVGALEGRVAALEAKLESIERLPVEEGGASPEPSPEAEPGPVAVAQETAVKPETPPKAEVEPLAEQDVGVDLEAIGELGEVEIREMEEVESGAVLLEELDLEETIEPGPLAEEAEEAVDLDLIDEIEKAVAGAEQEVKSVLSGETILILGGEEQYKKQYSDVVEQLGGTCEWYRTLAGMPEEEIGELVDRSHLILTLSDAITDPGVLEATNYAQLNNKRCFSHHSANPTSVRSQIVKLVNEGKI